MNEHQPEEVEDASRYCHAIEAYLCRKNDGHLIRIVGPAFEQVCGWAERGIPLRVAFRGVDRCFERYYAKGPRRRPVRIEFCEADILDVFDEWRRAVGVSPTGSTAVPDGGGPDVGPVPVRADSLPAHLERAVAKLTTARAQLSGDAWQRIEQAIRELDAMRGPAKSARGDARLQMLERLRLLDAAVLEAARAACDVETLRVLGDESDADLRPFRSRMAPEVYADAHRAAVNRLLRDRFRLPVLTYDR